MSPPPRRDRDARPRADDRRPPAARSDGGRAAAGRSAGRRSDGDRDRGSRAARPDAARADAARPDEAAGATGPRRRREPTLPESVDPKALDREARAELRSLPPDLADRVAAHLVAAGEVFDDDPQAAHAHAWYARQLAPRLAISREAAGLTAYRIGDFAAALAELRAVRRMTGDSRHLPVMADCERGLGRPERALALARDPDVKRLDAAARVELAIVVSGARRDRGEHEAAVVGLQGAALGSNRVEPWTARLWYAYAEALLSAGRRDEALRWFESAASVDDEELTDAADRIAEISGSQD